MAEPNIGDEASAASETFSAVRFKGTARYEVIASLGQGGMGVVYEAFDRQRRERVALKTLLHFDAAALYRFKQEFRTLADVGHPNLVHLHELVAGERDNVFFTMELVEGTDFLGYVRASAGHRPDDKTEVRSIGNLALVSNLPPDSSPDLRPGRQRTAPQPSRETRALAGYDADRLRHALRQLVEGVRALHDAGKLHRDLKPSNVRVTPEGRVVILDFGVATELRASPGEVADDEMVGTATYMAPEQASGEAPVAASDWYSVGTMLYEALVGSPPFSGPMAEVLMQKCTVLPAPPSSRIDRVPPDLDELCMALLAMDASGRPNASDILRRLGATTSDRATAPPPDASGAKVRLVGRERQMGELEAAFEASCEGRTIAVHLSGKSGLGKSALAHLFLDHLQARKGVLVLRGRAYERESVPYKALDSIVDALSRQLIDAQERGESIARPDDAWALAHVFPVLRRVHAIDAAPPASVGDPQVVRQLAFAGLRQTFASLCRQKRVVVFIDDVQWGDGDSAALLVELVRQPDAPPLLLLMTHRAEQQATSPFLADLRARWPDDAEVRDVTVEPLGMEDARRLVLDLLGSDGPLEQRTADEIAREAGGNPFLLEELARGSSAHHRAAMGDSLTSGATMRLDEMLGRRAARLPAEARRLLEVIAIGGRPLALTTVKTAAGVERSVTQLVAMLQARRFVHSGMRDGVETIEMIHDRVRETIVGQVPPVQVMEYHGCLARVLETEPDSDPEALASHLLGAGDKERAARYAERAGEQALAKLAFAQAARLFRLTVETLDWPEAESRRLYRRAAEAAEWAGLAEDSARLYLAAARGAPGVERVDLERAAAAQLIAAGRIDEGTAVFRRVLAAVGRPVPRSILAIIFWVIVYRIASARVGYRVADRDGGELSSTDRVRLDALSSAARGLTVIDPTSSMYVKARYLHDALRSGHRGHIVHAASAEASTMASAGGQPSKRERVLFEFARRTAREADDPEASALSQIIYGICLYLRGQWKDAVAQLDTACERLAAARRWNANASVYAVYALVPLGELREVRLRTARLLAEAERHGDLYTAVNLRASHPIASWLAADDLEGARRGLRESMKHWPDVRFLVQHWQAMFWEAETALYAGDGAAAWQRIERDALRLRRSFLLNVQLIRALTHYVLGCAAVASLPSAPASERRARLARAKKAAHKLEREAMTWTQPLAAMLSAVIAQAAGDGPGTEGHLQRAATLAAEAQMPLHSSAATYRLAQLQGHSEAAAAASEAMRALGVRAPERYVGMLLPDPSRPTT